MLREEPIGSAAFGSLLYSVMAAAAAPSGDVYVIGNYVTGGYNVPETPGGFLVHVPADGSLPRTLKLGQRLTGLTVAPDGRAFIAGGASAGLPTTTNALQR